MVSIQSIRTLFETRKRYSIVYSNYLSVMLGVYEQKERIRVVCRDGYTGFVNFQTAVALVKAFIKSSSTLKPSEAMNLIKRVAELGGESLITSSPILCLELATEYQTNEQLAKIIKMHESEEFLFGGKVVKLHGMLKNGDYLGVFVKEDYKFLEPENEVVIDVGANIGDSAIYFLLRGARKVIALEPYPHSYFDAKRNLQENGFQDRIVLLNAGYGMKGEISVEDNKSSNGSSDLIASRNEGISIRLYTLRDLLDHFSIDSAVLKMDCEGCEYNLINESDNVLRKFKRILIEYHYGYKKLKNKLEQSGFSVRCSEPINFYESYKVANKYVSIGYIWAIREK